MSYAMSGPNAAYDEAIRALADALDQPSLQIAHETTLAREYAQSGNRNAAAGTGTGRLEAENAVLRNQLIVLRRKVRGLAQLTNNDRRFFVQLYRWFPSILHVLMIIRPETLVRWHRAGFRSYWRG